ncbi:MAG: 16S rRNA (cytosine(1402)-N(4))-methyltransferase, partial [Patescibacteria group bacterium]
LQFFGRENAFFARSIASAIVGARTKEPFRRTGQLVEVIRQATPIRYQHGRTHFATRTFQALRMAVNDELGAIEEGILGIIPFLKSSGRVAVITFHSVEDRLVKRLFRTLDKEEHTLSPVTKKPIIPSVSEVKRNPRARSAKLRVVEKL